MKMLPLALFVALLVPVAAQAVVVAQEDFDGGAFGLISSTVPLLDGGAGDFFGVGNRNAWPQGFPAPGVPFSLADDTVVAYSNGGAPFPTDNEGIFGENSNFDNDYFALSDTREWTANQLVASWTFDVDGYHQLALRVDMGGITNSASGGFTLDTDLTFSASIDGGAEVVVFDLNAIENPGFVTRLMDNGIASGGGRLLQVVGPNPVTKLLAENGAPAANTYLDKTVPNGQGAGRLDTFEGSIAGAGSQLTITMRASVPFEAAAFDNVVITGDAVTASRPSTWGRVKSTYR